MGLGYLQIRDPSMEDFVNIRQERQMKPFARSFNRRAPGKLIRLRAMISAYCAE